MKRMYAYPAQYPPLKVQEFNAKYARMLGRTLASNYSELTTITTYLYQQSILVREHPGIADVISKISAVEIRHYTILSQLIEQLGGDPKCICIENNRFVSWNGTMVNYNKEPQEIITMNMESEQQAQQTYLDYAEQFDDEYLCAMMKRLAMDEKVHADLFSEILNKYQF